MNDNEERPVMIVTGRVWRNKGGKAEGVHVMLVAPDDDSAVRTVLDALTRETMQQELLRIAAKTGKTVLFITHQIDEAVLLGDRVAVLAPRPGRVIEVIDIDFPRPRSLDMKRSRELQAYVDHIWHLVSASEASAGGE